MKEMNLHGSSVVVSQNGDEIEEPIGHLVGGSGTDLANRGEESINIPPSAILEKLASVEKSDTEAITNRFRDASTGALNILEGISIRHDRLSLEAEQYIKDELKVLTERLNELRAYLLEQVSLSIQK